VSGTALPAGVAAPAALDEDYRKLLDLLADSPAPVDLLVRRSGLTAEIVSSMLLILELEGYVATAPGGLYSRLV
ncbi:MAG TPA: DNA-protecting protein DprA, partial [Plasticicumulans sp.]|nr:DNA-protecting protein DprA [Plasticicumulans sp.]